MGGDEFWAEEGAGEVRTVVLEHKEGILAVLREGVEGGGQGAA